MNCNKAETLMLKQAENVLSTAEATDLAQHVQTCDTCREYYFAFIDVVENFSEQDMHEAPAGFTASVMSQISTSTQTSEKFAQQTSRLALRIIWGITAIIFGAAMFFAYNPGQLTRLANAYPAINIVTDALYTFWISLGAMFGQFVQNMGEGGIDSGLGTAALGFVVILSILLVVLHKDEEAVKA